LQVRALRGVEEGRKENESDETGRRSVAVAGEKLVGSEEHTQYRRKS
jgi:hypothetical protein